jgi:hypothetical protein
MAATFEFNEDNGASTGSPPKGTTRNTAVTQNNWKRTDDVATAYTASTINATSSENSYTKHQFGKFTGTFNLISAGLWAHTAGVLGTGLTLHGKVQTLYTTPATTTDSGMSSATDMTAVIAIGSGATVLFHTTGPEAATPTTTLAAAGFTQYLSTQLQTGPTASAGDTTSVTLTLRYDEN